MAITISEKKIEDKDQNLLDTLNMVYPVGSIYMSVNSTSPASLFGGTWEQIKDRFLLAAGDTYSAGSTGGEATHTLTVDEMPSHYHRGMDIDGVYVFGWDSGTKVGFDFMRQTNYSGNKTAERLSTLSTGGSQPHNNMPPYITVYMWKRTA